MLKIRLEILSFLTFNMNEIQNQQIMFALKGKLEHIAHKMLLNICFGNHVNRILDTYFLFIIKLCFKKLK